VHPSLTVTTKYALTQNSSFITAVQTFAEECHSHGYASSHRAAKRETCTSASATKSASCRAMGGATAASEIHGKQGHDINSQDACTGGTCAA